MEKVIIGFTAILAFVASYFWNIAIDNFESFLAIIAVIFFDGFAGILRSVKLRNFRTYKAIKTVQKLFVWIIILATALLIEKGFSEVSFISETIIIPFITFEFISGLKNLSLAGVIDLSFLKHIDLHKENQD